VASVWSADTLPSMTSKQRWADITDDDNDDWPSMWAPCQQPAMIEISIASVQPRMPTAVPSAGMTKASSKAEQREVRAAAAKAKRAALTDAVLEGLLRQAQGPYVYKD